MKQFPTVQYKGKNLHSSYNPLKEAQRALSSHNHQGKSLFILFEPGYGYIIEALLEENPQVQLITLSFLNELAPQYKNHPGVTVWTREIGPLDQFLLNHIHESDLNRVSYLPWPASVRLMPEEASESGRAVKSVMETLKGNHSNILGFGRKSLKNSITNYLGTHSSHLPIIKGKKVLIIASGASLERVASQLKERVKEYFTIALPSSVLALNEWGIPVDLIISTDAGFWASHHFRNFPSTTPVGIVLGARAERGKSPVFPLLSQGSFIEKELLGDLALPLIPSTGTVAFTAIHFAQQRGAKEITLLGLDLCFSDIKSHVSPHSFDNYLLERTLRTSPYQGMVFNRALQMTKVKKGNLRFGHALSHYKNWIENRNLPSSLKRCCPGTPPIKGLLEINEISPEEGEQIDWVDMDWAPIQVRIATLKEKREFWKKELGILIKNQSLFTEYPTDFADFIYTLFPREFSLIRKEFSLDRAACPDKIESLNRDFATLMDHLGGLSDRLS